MGQAKHINMQIQHLCAPDRRVLNIHRTYVELPEAQNHLSRAIYTRILCCFKALPSTQINDPDNQNTLRAQMQANQVNYPDKRCERYIGGNVKPHHCKNMPQKMINTDKQQKLQVWSLKMWDQRFVILQ